MDLDAFCHDLEDIAVRTRIGRVVAITPGGIHAEGLSLQARIGDTALIRCRDGAPLGAEVLSVGADRVLLLAHAEASGVSLGDPVALAAIPPLRPGPAWLGRIVDAFGRPLDGGPPPGGGAPVALARQPPPAAERRGLGRRLATGLSVFDTLLPLARGQRLGIFAGSGVGKSSLLGQFARAVEADHVVIALIGERGRELGGFVRDTLGPEGLARSVVVAATSDAAPLVKRRALWSAMAVAESFRDRGEHVLLLVDSLTRFAEAHREVALAAGETPSLRAFPPSTGHVLASLVERAGPGAGTQGDITALFTVLVAGSDMEEPVADMTRGLLDGHVVLDRGIAERGRFPAVDVRRSVSRSLPAAASPTENALIARVRALLGTYEDAALMVQSGLYQAGSDPLLDQAVALWPKLDAFFASPAPDGVADSFRRLAAILGPG